MLVTSLGLASSHNFLSLPVEIVGLWKFGFPEMLMYLYLGLFSEHNSRSARLSDFLNGIGTVLHHASSAWILTMLVVGVIPPSRYVTSPVLILITQHWVVLLSYSHSPLYTGIVMVLEYYFLWIVICKLRHLSFPLIILSNTRCYCR